MNTSRFTDDKIHAYEMNNAAFWRERMADRYDLSRQLGTKDYWKDYEYVFDYGDFYRKPRISYRPLRAALLCTAMALLAVYFLAGVM